MTLNAILFQAINGLSSASTLFFVAVGLSLIFGVTRIVNIAHGSLYMLGAYIAYTFATRIGGGLGFWGGIAASATIVGLLGALIEVVVLRPIYRAPELFQLLATFALVLVINDATLWLWGPEDLLGPRAPGLRGAIELLGRRLPSYDLFLIFLAPLALTLHAFTQRHVAHFVVPHRVAAPLRLQHQREGGIGVDVDAFDRVHLDRNLELGCHGDALPAVSRFSVLRCGGKRQRARRLGWYIVSYTEGRRA